MFETDLIYAYGFVRKIFASSIFFVVKLFLYTVLFHNVTNTTLTNIVLRIICKTIFRYWGFDGKGSTAANTEKVLFNQTPFQSQLHLGLYIALPGGTFMNAPRRSMNLTGSFYFFRLVKKEIERSWKVKSLGGFMQGRLL